MSKISPAKFALRHEVVRYAVAHGNHAAARRYACSRNTVKLWRKRWEDGDDSFADHSRRPHHSPKRTCAKVAAKVISARKQAPCFGARRLVGAALRVEQLEHELKQQREQEKARDTSMLVLGRRVCSRCAHPWERSRLPLAGLRSWTAPNVRVSAVVSAPAAVECGQALLLRWIKEMERGAG